MFNSNIERVSEAYSITIPRDNNCRNKALEAIDPENTDSACRLKVFSHLFIFNGS